ncbi:hypothetical protein [Streptococcus oriscaviae]
MFSPLHSSGRSFEKITSIIFKGEVSSICEIRIVKKAIFDCNMQTDRYIWGVVVINNSEEEYSPVYPYIRSERDMGALKEFLETFKDDLLAFYLKGDGLYFSRHLFYFDTELKDRFKNRWFERGVLID